MDSFHDRPIIMLPRLVKLTGSIVSFTSFFFDRNEIIEYYEKEFIDYNKMLSDPIHWTQQYIDLILSLTTINNIPELEENILCYIKTLQEDIDTIKHIYPETKKNIWVIINNDDTTSILLENPHAKKYQKTKQIISYGDF